jgi:hypothetical protein
MATAVISNKQKQKVKNIQTSDYPIASIIDSKRTVSIKQVLPFRIKFSNITVPGYSASNVPPIGIAIIGLNNYIL